MRIQTRIFGALNRSGKWYCVTHLKTSKTPVLKCVCEKRPNTGARTITLLKLSVSWTLSPSQRVQKWPKHDIQEICALDTLFRVINWNLSHGIVSSHHCFRALDESARRYSLGILNRLKVKSTDQFQMRKDSGSHLCGLLRDRLTLLWLWRACVVRSWEKETMQLQCNEQIPSLFFVQAGRLMQVTWSFPRQWRNETCC